MQVGDRYEFIGGRIRVRETMVHKEGKEIYIDIDRKKVGPKNHMDFFECTVIIRQDQNITREREEYYTIDLLEAYEKGIFIKIEDTTPKTCMDCDHFSPFFERCSKFNRPTTGGGNCGN